ncbi:MAG: NIPSNAP family protein [Candidatus Binatia bacterium]
MIVDHRTYWVKPGKVDDYLTLYQTQALPLQLKYLGHCVGWYVSNDIGPSGQEMPAMRDCF